nr:uncharacterized protein LOC109410566 isoform X1 [Aedes albopictus]
MGSIDLSHWLMFTFDAKTTVRETELFDVYPRLSRRKKHNKMLSAQKVSEIYGSEIVFTIYRSTSIKLFGESAQGSSSNCGGDNEVCQQTSCFFIARVRTVHWIDC